MSEQARTPQQQELVDAYKQRYEGLQEQTEINVQYPDFPSLEDIGERVKQDTEFPLVTYQGDGAYEDGNLIYPIRLHARVAPETLRAAFDGTDAELEDALNYGKRGFYGTLQMTDSRLTLPTELAADILTEKRTEAVAKQAEEVTYQDIWWMSKDSKLDKEIAEGRLSEWYEFRKGEHSIKLFNCDRPMTEVEVEEMRMAIDHMAEATHDQLFAHLDTIVLQHMDRFADNRYGITVGQAHPKQKLFRLNTILRDLASLQDRSKEIALQPEGYSSYIATLVHEIGHLLDPSPSHVGAQQRLDQLDTGFEQPLSVMMRDLELGSSVFQLLGWQARQSVSVDAEGKERTHWINGITQPSKEIWIVDEHGSEKKVAVEQHFTEEEIITDVPVSQYGSTKAGEDFAESFTAYCLNGPGSLGPLRRAILEHTLTKLMASDAVSYDPHAPLTVEKQALEDLPIDFSVPKQRPIAVFIESTKGWRKAPDWMKTAKVEDGYFL